MSTSTLPARLARASLLVAGLAVFSGPLLAGAPPTAPRKATGARAQPVAAQATLDQQFVANRKQWPEQVLYAADIPMGRLYLGKNKLTHALYDVRQVDELQHHKKAPKDARIKAHAYTVTFEKANPEPVVQNAGKVPFERNYFLGNDRSRWATHVPAYTEVRYQQLYPGTDLRVYSKDAALEYDFELAAGADPARIQMRYDGADKLSVDAEGALRIATSVGTVAEQRPFAYQEINGKRQEVPCAFQLKGQVVSFTLPKGYDRQHKLVIDPVLVYSTYSGSSASNYGYTATFDSLGNLYSGGVVFSSGFPTTTGAYDVSWAGSQDMGILKYNPTAFSGQTSLLYATYIGGTGADHPHSMVVDHANNLLILGSTSNNNFPVTNGVYDNSYNGAEDIVVSKLNSTGSQLLASTYLGGSGSDGQITGTLQENYGDSYRGDVNIDRQNNVYIASVSYSTNFPTPGGFQTARSGTSDAVVAKFSSNLATLQWSTLLGGSGAEAAYSIQLDSARNVFVSGGTTSTNLPGVTGSVGPTYKGGSADGFVALIAASDNALRRAAYVGTSAYDQAYFVQLDKASNVYLLGQTEGAYPVTQGKFTVANSRLFIHKLNYELTTSLYSTRVGAPSSSSVNLSPTAFLIDNCNQILLSSWGGGGQGSGDITGAPVTPDAIRADGSGGSFYLMQLADNATRLVYGSYFGTNGPHVDGGTSRFDKSGTVYQSMCVSGGLPTTPNAFSTTNRAGYNNAAFKMDILQLNANFTPTQVPLPGSPVTKRGCAPLNLFFVRPGVSGTSLLWDFGDGTTSTDQNTLLFHIYTRPGRYIVRLTVFDPNNCLQSATRADTIVVLGLPRTAAGPDKTICPGSSTELNVTTAGATYASITWSPATGLSSATGARVTASPAVTTTYIVRGTTPEGCTGTDTVRVIVAPLPNVAFAPSTRQAFTGEAITFGNTTTNAATYAWDFGDGTTSTVAAPTHTYDKPGTYEVRLRATSSGQCVSEQRLTIEVRKFEVPNVITPNGDGKNDTFKPFVSFAGFDLDVYNRWGRKVYSQKQYKGDWGTDVPAGTYYYHLRSATGDVWKGTVEVIR